MGLFQVGGHIFSSIAISRIPVSTVHTIKVSTTGPSTFKLEPTLSLKGSFSLIHRGRLRLTFRRQLLNQDLPVPPTSYRWRHVGMFI
jgi:hypothetical protein